MRILGVTSSGFFGGSDYELIETSILGSSQTSVTFNNLENYSSTYKHLQIRGAVRVSAASLERTIVMRVNSDTGANYASHWLDGNGSSVSSGASTSRNNIILISTPANSATSGSFLGMVVDLLDPYSTTKNKTVRAFGGNTTTPQVRLISNLWMNIASITNIEIGDLGANNLLAGTRLSLYGIKG
jgi:hypothetical protein